MTGLPLATFTYNTDSATGAYQAKVTELKNIRHYKADVVRGYRMYFCSKFDSAQVIDSQDFQKNVRILIV